MLRVTPSLQARASAAVAAKDEWWETRREAAAEAIKERKFAVSTWVGYLPFTGIVCSNGDSTALPLRRRTSLALRSPAPSRQSLPCTQPFSPLPVPGWQFGKPVPLSSLQASTDKLVAQMEPKRKLAAPNMSAPVRHSVWLGGELGVEIIEAKHAAALCKCCMCRHLTPTPPRVPLVGHPGGDGGAG